MTGTEPWRAVLAVALLGLVAWVPGYGLHRVLLPGRGRLAALATAPALSAGLLYASGLWCTAAHLPVDARLAFALTAGSLAAMLLARRGHSSTGRRASRAALAAVGAAVVLGTAIWALGMRHLTAVAPHNDGYNHGFFVRRIWQLHTLQASRVMPHDVLLGGHGVDYYPLALHLEAAVVVQTTHVDVAVAWTLASLGTAVLALPLGMLLLGRSLFPRRPEIAGACAVFSALVPGLAYSTAWWGGFALAAGFAASGAVLVLGAELLERWTWRLGMAGSLALVGVAGIHTSEFSLVLVLLGVLALSEPAERTWRHLFLACGRLGLLVGLSLLLLTPALIQLRRGLTERAYPVPVRGVPLADAVREVLVQYSFVPPVTPTALILAFWVGLGIWVVSRRPRWWLASWLLFALLYVWLAGYPSPLVSDLTSTWYSDRFRLTYILAFLSVPFVALAVTGGLRSRFKVLRMAGPVLGVLLAATAAVSSVHAIRRDYRQFSLVGSDERRAFTFLARHASPEGHVLNQHQDGSPWMYALYGVAPVVALKTFDFDRPEWRSANYLARHVQDAGRDPRVDQLLLQFHVRYVFVRLGTFPTEQADLQIPKLDAAPALRLVFVAGRSRVYEVLA